LSRSSLKFNPVLKDRLFYDQYRYCIKFYIQEASVLVSLDHAQIDSRLTRRVEWRETLIQTRVQVFNVFPTRSKKLEITQETRQHLHELCDVLLAFTDQFKLVVSEHHCWVYTNVVKVIQQLSDLQILKNKQFSEAIINRPKNTILLKNSSYQYRSYLQSTNLTSADKTKICNFFNNQQDSIRLGPALTRWTGTKFNRTQDYFFIDHFGESWLIMLNLVHPGLIRKTVHIISGK